MTATLPAIDEGVGGGGGGAIGVSVKSMLGLSLPAATKMSEMTSLPTVPFVAPADSPASMKFGVGASVTV